MAQDVSKPNLRQRVQNAASAFFGPGGAPEEKPRDWNAELAWGGATIMGGLIRDDHRPELEGQSGAKIASEMRRSDAQVRAVEKVISLPIRATEWDVVEPEKAGSAEKEATALLKANLFGGMETSWDDLLREACLAIYYGFRAPEIVWEEREGVIAVKKIASRNPERVEQWLWDEAGRLVGVLYTGNKPRGSGLSQYPAQMTDYARVALPIEKCLHFVYDAENERPAGFGLFRSMHPHWFIKQALYKVMGLGIERNYLETPVGEVADDAQAGARDKLLKILKNWRAIAGAAVVLAPGEKLNFQGSQRGLMDPMPFLLHQDAKILQSGLCTFLGLGQGEHGTQALAAELVKVFELAEDANARWIEQTINQQLVRRWLALNFPGAKLKAPRVTHRPIRAIDLTALGNFLASAVTGGLIHPLPEDEQKLRALGELPAIPLEQLKANAEQARKNQLESAEQARAMLEKAERDAKARQARERIDCDRCGGIQRFSEADVEKLRAARDAQEQEFTDRARGILEGLQQDYLAALRPLLEDHADADKIAKGIPLRELPKVEVPGARKYSEFVRSYLWSALQQGREALATETGQDIEQRPVSNQLRNWVTAKAQVIADSHVGQLRSSVLDRVLTGVRAELEPSLIFSDAGAEAIETLTRAVRDDWGMAAAELLASVETRT